MAESFRLCLIQILLQSRGIRLNPITTLYYVAPACFAFLLIPFSFNELPLLVARDQAEAPLGWLLVSAVSAFGRDTPPTVTYCTICTVP